MTLLLNARRGRPRAQLPNPGQSRRWQMVVQIVALLMGIAAEPAWQRGSAMALLGAVSMLAIASGVRLDISQLGFESHPMAHSAGRGQLRPRRTRRPSGRHSDRLRPIRPSRVAKR